MKLIMRITTGSVDQRLCAGDIVSVETDYNETMDGYFVNALGEVAQQPGKDSVGKIDRIFTFV